MDVKIIKSSKDSYWYTDQIGLIFEVTGIQENIYEVRKWVDFPNKYDIAPVLKEDCKELYGKNSPVEARRNPHWQMKVSQFDRMNKLAERSGFNTGREIDIYERLNKEAEIKSYKKKEENR